MTEENQPELTLAQRIGRLKDPNSQKRLEALNGLFGARQALPHLVPLLDDPDDEVRAEATFVVGELSDDILEIPPEFYAPNNADILSNQKLIEEVVIPKFAELLNDPYSKVRAEALLRAPRFRIEPSEAQLDSFISDPDGEVKLSAFYALANSPFTIKPGYLRDLLADPNIKVQRAAIQSLGNKRDIKNFPYLKPFLKDENSALRIAALSAIGDLKGKKTKRFKKIIPLLKDPDVEVRSWAIMMLEKLNSKKAIPFLTGFLTDENPELRKNVIRALGKLGDKGSAKVFLEILAAETDFWTRFQAVEALGKTGDRAALPVLQDIEKNDASQDAHYKLNEAAAEAIARIKKRSRTKK